MKSKIPMGRFVQIPEIAAMVAWIASRECAYGKSLVVLEKEWRLEILRNK